MILFSIFGFDSIESLTKNKTTLKKGLKISLWHKVIMITFFKIFKPFPYFFVLCAKVMLKQERVFPRDFADFNSLNEEVRTELYLEE